MTENCRVKTASSLALTPLPKVGRLNSLPFSDILVGVIFWRRSWLCASVLLVAFISPATELPERFVPRYVKTGMVTLLSGQTSNCSISRSLSQILVLVLRSDRVLSRWRLTASARRSSHPAVDHVLKFIGIGRARKGNVQSDGLLEVSIRQALIERLHARDSGSGLHRRVDLVNLVFADQVTDSRRGNQDFHHHRTSAAVSAGQERLTENPFQYHGELRANLRLLVSGKNVDDTIDGRGSRVRVQRGKGQVAGFGDAERGFDRFQVSHFSDEHHVGVFTERGTQRVRERMGVRVNFALVDQALLVVVEEFDRILDGDHVLFALCVDLVEHSGERGGLTGTRRPGNKHKTARFVAQTTNDVRQAERVEALDFPRNGTEHSAHGSALVKDVAAETSKIFQAEGEVQLEVFLEAMLLRIGQHAICQRLGVGGSQRRHIQRTKTAVNADARGAVRGDVEVAAPHLDHLFQQFA